MKKLKKQYKISLFLFLSVLLLSVYQLDVHAATGKLYYGSDEYNQEYDEEFFIGVYLESEVAIGEYHVELSYDERYMTYVDGADEGGNGTITLSGDLNDNYKKYLISFQALSGGDTALKIESADVKTVNGEPVTISDLPAAPVFLSVNSNATIENLIVNGEELADFEEDIFSYDLEVPYEVEELELEAETDEDITVDTSDLALLEGENIIYVEAKGEGNASNIYTLYVNRANPPATEEPVEEDDSAVDTPISTEEAEGESQKNDKQDKGISVLKIIMIVFGIVWLTCFVVFACYFFLRSRRKKTIEALESKKERRVEKEEPRTRDGELSDSLKEDLEWFEMFYLDGEEPEEEPHVQLEPVGKQQHIEERKIVEKQKPIVKTLNAEGEKETKVVTKPEADKKPTKIEEPKPQGEPVISIRNVGMLFKVAVHNVSGLKEFFIQKLKGKISYREFWALSHISFDVYRGEVVGIIGTNGSGKSTLLKIVSGALKPTYGKVEVDRSKVQLLTLGTGFDMELTAKENVYLNGAIIGYSREFIDSVYDDIVKFAELEDFMEEKVKNFSSGMVSRLGFAIATIGDAPEILILDEVLSVGDEFFRKKSLKRVKEMIHGGSTVLMVSHGMGTIKDNCSKVVWIEKGELKMVGDAKTVCKAYQDMGNTEG